MLWQEITYVLDSGFGVPPSFAVLGIAPRSDLLTAIKEFARWHHLNESTIAERKTPSDSEIDAEVEAWTKIKRLTSRTEPGAITCSAPDFTP